MLHADERHYGRYVDIATGRRGTLHSTSAAVWWTPDDAERGPSGLPIPTMIDEELELIPEGDA